MTRACRETDLELFQAKLGVRGGEEVLGRISLRGLDFDDGVTGVGYSGPFGGPRC